MPPSVETAGRDRHLKEHLGEVSEGGANGGSAHLGGANPRPKKGWPLRILVIGTVVGIALTLGGQWLLKGFRARPIDARGVVSMFPGADAGSVGGIRAVGPEFRYGDTYTYGFTVQNTSRWTVEVLDFPVPDSYAMLERVGVRLGPPPGELQRRFPSGEPGDAVPFRSFTLHPDQSRVVFVYSRFTNCGNFGVGVTQGYSTVGVRYRIQHYLLKTTRTAELPLGHEIIVAAPGAPDAPSGAPRQGCPELRFDSGETSSAEADVILEANVRFWLPHHRLWLTNNDPFEWRNCRLTLGTTSGEFVQEISRVPPRKAVLREASGFVNEQGAAWDPSNAKPQGLVVRCDTEKGSGIVRRVVQETPAGA